jgi:hypothetical protein
MRLIFRILLIVATVSLSSSAPRAEEESSGHYFPGALSSFTDMLPESTGEVVAGTQCEQSASGQHRMAKTRLFVGNRHCQVPN